MNFAVFILSHGRPNNVLTYDSLRKYGYTGKIYILIDNEDECADEYFKVYGDQVIVFDKKSEALVTDAGDNLLKRNTVLYARNANFKVAKNLNITHFWQLDDDYTEFRYSFNHKLEYITKSLKIRNLDNILEYAIDFLNETNSHCIAFSQGGDFIGGPGSSVAKNAMKGRMSRKVMNSFLFRTEKPIKFLGRMNDDVNTYVTLGSKGILLFTLGLCRLEQQDTQKNAGGLTEMYLEMGTYKKSFYTVMMSPSSVTIREMGVRHKRLHHFINAKMTYPYILSERHKGK
jgi:hypothetical protein